MNYGGQKEPADRWKGGQAPPRSRQAEAEASGGAVEQSCPDALLFFSFQVLLSQVHRLRALDLLGRFLDLGPWAVSLVRAACLPWAQGWGRVEISFRRTVELGR